MKLQKLTKNRRADTPWTSSMSNQHEEQRPSQHAGPSDTKPSEPQPTVAAFSPNQQTASQASNNRSSILIHQKSPLLVATPPQVTRALAYSHAFILPLNHVAGLLSWTTADPWESFLLLAGFWFTVLYGSDVIRWAGPLVVVVGLILGMYSRRYSPLSSTVWSGEKARRKRADSEQRKSLDEILETLRTFTGRCDVLLDPCLQLTEFLSTQSSATSATTRPALTTLFIRLLAFLPIWILLTLPPFYIVTTKRIALLLGTLGLTWHSRPARVTRTLLWRSRTVRNTLTLLTGLQFLGPPPQPIGPPPLPPRPKGAGAASALNVKGAGPGIRFTFTLWENQRRWIGLGWTANLLAYERQAWSDEHHNTCADPDRFELPDTEHDATKWRWVPGGEWRVEGAMTDKEKSAKRIGGGGGGDDVGWTYYDNKWQGGHKTDGWGRYTRRRKWVRDAELVDIDHEDEGLATPVPASSASEAGTESTLVPDNDDTTDATGIDSNAKRKGWFGGGKSGGHSRRPTNDRSDAVSKTGSGSTGESARSRDGADEDLLTPLRYRQTDWDRSIGDGVAMGLS
ncbi:hypothetical protein LTR36_000684 [Oleoguttula mirabilis]|uniref:Peroxin/Ferlin domain-containing protein n=1 Tax=Oleoguttula mirabilis TaxID=1507867 RepID=A0AAV9JQ63_9PEZI|nr:hypothetical protein LTR36_000684 [Oleoguttula mirabilis]